MLACSSKRALISTSATTCLPASAASISASTIGESPRGAVQRLLDRQHVRVGRGLLDEALDAGGERVVGVVHQHVALAQGGEEPAVGRLALGEARVGRRHERLVLQRRPVDVRRSPQRRSGPAARAAAAPRASVDVELADQQVEHVRVDRLRRPPAGPAGRTGAAPARARGPAAGPRRGPPRPRSRRCGSPGTRGGSTTSMPGNSSARCAAISVLERQELALRRDAATNRGTLLRHLDPGEVLAPAVGSRTRRPGSATARRCTGTGAPGRPPAGSAPGRPARRKQRQQACLLRRSSSSQRTISMPSSASRAARRRGSSAACRGHELAGALARSAPAPRAGLSPSADGDRDAGRDRDA